MLRRALHLEVLIRRIWRLSVKKAAVSKAVAKAEKCAGGAHPPLCGS